jgi:hypothetical protein
MESPHKKRERKRKKNKELDQCWTRRTFVPRSVPSRLMASVVPLGVELLVWEREELRGCTVLSWDDREWRDEMKEMNESDESDESARPVRPSRPFRPSQPIYRLEAQPMHHKMLQISPRLAWTSVATSF